jgi:hypothetical protein
MDRPPGRFGLCSRAGDLGPLRIAALGVGEHGATATPAEAADRKVRAFTLFTAAYDSAGSPGLVRTFGRRR